MKKKKPHRKTTPKNGNRKKTPRPTSAKRRPKPIKKTPSKKTSGNKGTPKKALVQETFRLLKEYANRSAKGNKGTGKKPKKRTVSKRDKQTNPKKRVKQSVEQKLREENKRLRKALKTQANTFGYKPEVLKQSPLDDLEETIRLLSEYTGVPFAEIKDEVPELGIQDVSKPIFDTSDRSILRIEFTESDYERKKDQLTHLDQKTLNIYRDRDPLLPRAFLPMLEITHNGQTITRANRMSPPGMNTTLFEIVTYCMDFMDDFKTSYFDYLKDHSSELEIDEDEAQNEFNSSAWVFDPNNVTALLIRFIYKPTE